MKRSNLEKLATYLEALPIGYQHFSMRSYLTKDGMYLSHPEEANTVLIDCGTIACAVGHAPAAGIPVMRGEDWDAYEARVFNLTTAEWKWCFSSYWTDVDDTPHGAAKRIRYMLEHGVPENAFYQMNGSSPYLFAEESSA